MSISLCPVCGMPREVDLIANSPCPVCALNDATPAPPPDPVVQTPPPVPATAPPPEPIHRDRRALLLAFLLGVIAGVLALSLWNHLRGSRDEVAQGDVVTPQLPATVKPLPTPPTPTPAPDPPTPTPTDPPKKVELPKIETSRTLGLKMVLIEPGEFAMGSWDMETGRKGDEFQHRVKLSQAFYIGVSEITQAEYRKLTGKNPSSFALKGRNEGRVANLNTDRFPVESLSWFDAIDFCNQLSARDMYPPFYELTNIKKVNDSITEATVKILGGSGYRLPTEAEWEYCCRAEAKSPFWFGSSNTGKESNVKPPMLAGGYGDSYPKWRDLNRPTDVGSYDANAWGLTDTHGNIAEWCQDWYAGDYYSKSPAQDPTGPAEGKQRVVRGGSWFLPESSARSASRYPLSPDERKDFVGFRVVRKP